MTTESPFADRLTRHQYRTAWHGPESEAQAHAERHGNVPPGVGPIEVKRFGELREMVWEWYTGKDSTGQLKELWFADGPWAGQRPRMIEADIPAGAVVAFPDFGPGFQEFDGDGNLNPMSIQYRIEQREDGLWFGRWIP